MGIGLEDCTLTIEKCTSVGRGGVPQYEAEPLIVKGHIDVKIDIDTEGKELNITNYAFITLNQKGLISENDKINGYLVKSIREVEFLGTYLVTEVIAI